MRKKFAAPRGKEPQRKRERKKIRNFSFHLALAVRVRRSRRGRTKEREYPSIRGSKLPRVDRRRAERAGGKGEGKSVQYHLDISFLLLEIVS